MKIDGIAGELNIRPFDISKVTTEFAEVGEIPVEFGDNLDFQILNAAAANRIGQWIRHDIKETVLTIGTDIRFFSDAANQRNSVILLWPDDDEDTGT